MLEGVHKLGRLLLAAFTVGSLCALRYFVPEITLAEIMAISEAAGIYILVKGTGYISPKDK